MIEILKRIVLAILIGILVAFAFWLVGWIIITFLPVSAGIIALGGIIQNVGYFAGVIAAIWYFVSGRTSLF